MKTLFIPATVNSEINLQKIKQLKLPRKIAIAYSIQYKEIALEIKKILSENHNITSFIQVLGCSKPKFKDTEAILLISSGEFHGISLEAESNIPVYVFESNNLRKISNEEINSFKKKKLASYIRYLNSEKIGILVSTKPGQENLNEALFLRSKLKNKNSYLFIVNEVNTREFENFPDVQSWVNTACPRLDFDASVINIADL